MNISRYLVFGDLHGRILPAFRLASAWAREHEVRVDAMLQVGDLGYYPDPNRLDKATRRHASLDPLELGAMLVADRSKDADECFADPHCPERLWFTAGNHEDHEALLERMRGDAFDVDAYGRLWCVRDGRSVKIGGGLQVGALWGIDDQNTIRRRTAAAKAYIREESAIRLACSTMDVLLTHDSPNGTVVPGAGSVWISDVIRSAKPQLAFFGHYHGLGCEVVSLDFPGTRLFHMAGLEMRGDAGFAEAGSVGLLEWNGTNATFEYLDPKWLRTFTRRNWRRR